jgi:hypothetical protein
MERSDLLYSGMMFAAGMLSLWTALLLTAAFVALAPSFQKSASSAATISSRRSLTLNSRALGRSALSNHGAEESPSSHSLFKALPQRSVLGRIVRFIQ